VIASKAIISCPAIPNHTTLLASDAHLFAVFIISDDNLTELDLINASFPTTYVLPAYSPLTPPPVTLKKLDISSDEAPEILSTTASARGCSDIDSKL